MDYKTWKTQYENEFDEHRKANCRLVYDYQPEYSHYRNSPDWIMYGDFCNFIRRGAENRGQEITAKYEAILVQDIEVFTGFVKDEFNRIHPLTDIDESLSQIFQYRNMKITPADFTPEQQAVFTQAVEEYKEANKKYIEMVSNW